MEAYLPYALLAVLLAFSGTALWSAWAMGCAGRGAAWHGLLAGVAAFCLPGIEIFLQEWLGRTEREPVWQVAVMMAGAVVATRSFALEAKRMQDLARRTRELEWTCRELVRSSPTPSPTPAP